MKRWIGGLAAVLASSMVSLSPWTNRVLALTQPEIIQKLQTVPVFILVDDDRNMVPLSIFDGEVQNSQDFWGIFISHNDAQDTLATLQAESSNRLNTLLVPLADAYNMIVNSQDLEDIPPFVFIPQTEQLELAAQVLLEQGEQVNLTPLTVPLFHLSSTVDNSYITISTETSDREFIPLFFDGNEAQSLLDLLKDQANANEEPAPTIELRVAFLHQWLRFFETNNGDALQLFEFIPIPESLALIANPQNQLPQQPDQPVPNQPSVQPPAQQQPSSEQPVPEQPSSEQPVPEQSSSEQPVPEQPSSEQSVPEQPSSEQPVPEQPSSEQPSSELLRPTPDIPSEPQPSELSEDDEVSPDAPSIEDVPQSERPIEAEQDSEASTPDAVPVPDEPATAPATTAE